MYLPRTCLPIVRLLGTAPNPNFFSIPKPQHVRTLSQHSTPNPKMSSGMMKAIVIHTPGDPSVLKLESRPIPTPKPGEVLIRIKAIGLNRSEMYTRLGQSPTVSFPRILGIEAAGLVDTCPGGEFINGDIVGTAMGGMGRDFDGGYAEYTCVPVGNVKIMSFADEKKVDWSILGALPEMMQTAYWALTKSLRLRFADRVLIRGGSSSVGLAAAAVAKLKGCYVASTTRNPDRESLLKSCGADEVFIDTGDIAKIVREKYPYGFHRILDLVGTVTLADSCKCAAEQGVVCMAGMLGNEWEMKAFSPMAVIPTSVCLTTHAGNEKDFAGTPFEELVAIIGEERISNLVGKVFRGLENIGEAHKFMDDESRAGGKIVVLVD